MVICECCAECEVKEYCDMVDDIIDNDGSLEGEHSVLLAIYLKGKEDAYKEMRGVVKR